MILSWKSFIFQIAIFFLTSSSLFFSASLAAASLANLSCSSFHCLSSSNLSSSFLFISSISLWASSFAFFSSSASASNSFLSIKSLSVHTSYHEILVLSWHNMVWRGNSSMTQFLTKFTTYSKTIQTGIWPPSFEGWNRNTDKNRQPTTQISLSSNAATSNTITVTHVTNKGYWMVFASRRADEQCVYFCKHKQWSNLSRKQWAL